MDVETGAPLLIDEEEVTAQTTFRARSNEGSVSVEFSFDSTGLKGKSVVVFETLEYAGSEIASHADLWDTEQTITFAAPIISTSAAGADGENTLDIGASVKLIDTVSYEGLLAGETYTLKGVLMDRVTGRPILIDGEEIRAETTFTTAAAPSVPTLPNTPAAADTAVVAPSAPAAPIIMAIASPAATLIRQGAPDAPVNALTTSAGTAAVTFTFNSASLIGKTAVVFESLTYKGREIAAHTDIMDDRQTVTFREPSISTSAAGADGGKELDISPKVKLTDTVSYDGLLAGQTYTLRGILMDKAAGTPLLIDGEEIRAESEFKPDAPEGTADVVFTFDSSGFIGKTAVVFELLECGGTVIASHADINDAKQTVTFKAPAISTSASGADGAKELDISPRVKLVDTVSYTNLTVGVKYLLKGVLMDKTTGVPLLIDGEEVRAEATFTPEDTDGVTEVLFSFNSIFHRHDRRIGGSRFRDA